MSKRIKLADRELPTYSKGEEIFNMVSHIVGKAHSAIGVISSCIYGFTLIALYTMSSVYHGLKPGMAKKVMQVLDHCTIYFLIAGSYTPILLVAMMPKYPVIAWFIFALVWGCAVVACTLTAIDLKKYRVMSMICYLAMGWVIIFFIKQTYDVMYLGGVVFRRRCLHHWLCSLWSWKNKKMDALHFSFIYSCRKRVTFLCNYFIRTVM